MATDLHNNLRRLMAEYDKLATPPLFRAFYNQPEIRREMTEAQMAIRGVYNDLMSVLSDHCDDCGTDMSNTADEPTIEVCPNCGWTFRTS